MLDGQLHIAPATQREAAGQLAFQSGRGQALQAHRVENGQGQQRQQQPPVDRTEVRRHREFQCPQGAQHNATGEQDHQPAQHQP
ncbi:hypothetical protein D3C85_1589170 [compost metagenome]